MSDTVTDRDDNIAMLVGMGGASNEYAARVLEESDGNVNRAMEQLYGVSPQHTNKRRSNNKSKSDQQHVRRHRWGDVDDSTAAQPPPVSFHKWQEWDTVDKTGYDKKENDVANAHSQAHSARKAHGQFSTHSMATERGTPRHANRNTVMYPGAYAVAGPDASSTSDEYKSTTSEPSAASITRTTREDHAAPPSILPVTARLVEDSPEDVDILHQQVRQQEEELRRIRAQQENAAARLDRIVREQQDNVVIVAQPMDEEAQVAKASGSGDKHGMCGSRMKWCLVVVIILAIIGAAVGAVLGLVVFKPEPTPQTDPTSVPTDPTNPLPTPLPSQVALTDLLSEHASFDDGAALQTPYTPQNKALNWLRDASNLDSFPDEKKIQRYIFATLYYSTNGAGWTRNDGWLSDDDECTWFIKAKEPICSSAGAASRLVFQDSLTEIGNNLVGSLPAEITFLSSSLEWLDVGRNTLTGSIPTEIGLLTALRENLALEHNSLKGSIPSEIGLLTALENSLGLFFNSLTGSVPSEIGLLTALTGLYLGVNELTGTIPSQIGLLTSLQQITLDFNGLTGTIPSEIGKLSVLTGLWLFDNQLTGTIPSEINSMSSLEKLRLYNNPGLKGPFTCPAFIVRECMISCKDDTNTIEACRSLP